MPTAMTFASLKEDIAAYLERGSSAAIDPTVYDQLPRLINQAEQRIADDVKVIGFKEPVTSTMTAGVAVYAYPDGHKETASINYGVGASNNERVPLYKRGYEYLRMFHPDETVQGAPRFYAEYDVDHFIVAPTPDAGYPFELVFYRIPPLLDDSNQTNWLTEKQPQLLLYGALVEVAMFLKTDPGNWLVQYQGRVAALNGNEGRKQVDQSTARTGA